MPPLVTIVGAGPGGYVAALRAAQLGAKVTLVEEYEAGGACLHWGCIPTKTILASTEALEMAKHAASYGIEISGPVSYSLQKIRERKDKVVLTQVKGIHALLKSRGVDFIFGRASILSDDVVRAVRKDGVTMDIKSDRIIIATGSRPAAFPGTSFDGDRVISSDDAVQLKKVPESLVIIGAGVIGCEFAFIYQSLGSAVTLVELLPHAIATEDEEISDLMERELKKAKIKLLTSVKVESIEHRPGGRIAVALANGDRLDTEQVLISIGRRMNSENLGLEAAGIVTGRRGEIVVNDRMETSIAGIYAIGDVTGVMMLAHVASAQGIIAAENALGGAAAMDYSAVPAGIFTTPEVGSVGLREQTAREQGRAVRIGRFQYRALGKAHAMGAITGMVKVISDAASDKVLGVHICGAHAADLVHEGALAVKEGVTAARLGGMIHAHPTLAEAIMEAAEDVHGRSIHTPGPGKRSGAQVAS